MTRLFFSHLGAATALASAVLLGALASACGDDTEPVTPCAADCGAHGQCILQQGRETCLCDEGHTGAACASCRAGYVPGASGDACVPDPCATAPCTQPYQTTCEAQGSDYVCLCDEGTQDNDGDGTCRPTCAAATAAFGGQACDDSSGEPLFTGTRSCQTVITLAAEHATGELYARGEFNNWELTAPLVSQSDGSAAVTLELPAGDYAYKLFRQGGEEWFEDPANPWFKWVDGIRNSRLRVPDCDVPLLRLVHQPQTAGGNVRFKVQYVDGASAAGLAAAGVTVTRNGQPATASYDQATGVLQVDDPNLAQNKYAYRFRAADNGGRVATLYVPVWVEDAPFDWRDGVLYFALTDRFADGDANNNAPIDGLDVRANWQGGDFAGIRQKIADGYFDALGVNAIWISSVTMSTQRAWPGDRGIDYAGYHGYWPMATGWTDEAPMEGVVPIEPHFGTLEELEAMVAEAHAHGIRVLVDLVANHVHEDSPWWTNHQSDSPPWFHLPALGCKESNWEQPIICWFAGYLPDLEYKNTVVMDAVLEHAAWLVERTDIDGFRLDAVKHMVDDVVYGVRGRVEQIFRDTGVRFYMVGETFTGEDGADQLKAYIGPRMLDGQFDFPLYWQLTAVFMREERDLKALEGMTRNNDTLYGDFPVMSTFLGNHDVCRAISHANGDIGDLWCNGGKDQAWDAPPATPTDPAPYAKLRLAWTFLFTSPGVPLVYYGDEFGLEGAGDPDNRRFMRFDAGLNGQQSETLQHVRALGEIRRAHPALRRGSRATLYLAEDGGTWIYAMSTAGDTVIVALHRQEAARTVNVSLAALGLGEVAAFDELLGGDVVSVVDGALTWTFEGRSSAVWVPR